MKVQKVRDQMKKKNVTGVALAKRLGLSKMTISRFLNEKTSLNSDDLLKTLKILGLNIDDVV